MTRFDRRTVAFALIGLALIASAALLAYWGRGQTFGGDELQYASRLSTQSLGHAMLYPPPGGYLIAVPMLVYKALLETAGLGAYAPHRAVAIALELTCAILFFALARRRVGDLWAVPPTVLMLFFGFGSESILTADRIPGSMALAAGLGAFLALARPTLRRDVIAALLLTLSVASHPVGISFAAGATVLVLWRPSPGRWLSAWVFLLPSILYADWWLFLRPADPNPTQTRLSELAHFVGQSWAAVTAAISGLAGVLDGPAYHHALGWLAAALLLALVAGGAAASWRRLTPQFWAAAAALLTLWVTTGLTRNALLIIFRPADQPRYVYPAAFLMLLMLVELAGALRLPSRPARAAAWAATGVLALGLAANVDQLNTAAAQNRRFVNPVRIAYGATEIASKTVRPDFYPLGFFYPNAGRYLAAVRAYGGLGYSAAELRTRSARTRFAADKVLVKAERLKLGPDSTGRPDGGKAPRAATALQGTARTAGGCLGLQPTRHAGSFAPQGSIPPPPPSLAAAAPPALAELTLPSGGVQIQAKRLGAVAVRIGRFASVPRVPLVMPRAGRFASLSIPADGTTLPWKLIVYASEPVSVCGLRP